MDGRAGMRTARGAAPHAVRARRRATRRLLIGAWTWGPLLGWLAWLALDRALDLHPWAAGAGAVTLVGLWFAAHRGSAAHSAWITLIGSAVVFGASYAVAADGADSGAVSIGGFIVISTLAWALSNSVRGALISTWAADLVHAQSYGAIENAALRNVMLNEVALMTGIAAGRSGDLVGGAVAIPLGLLVGMILSWFVFALVYAAMNIALTLTHRDGGV